MSQRPREGDSPGSSRDVPSSSKSRDIRSRFRDILQRREYYEKPPKSLDDESRRVLEAKTRESESRNNQRRMEKELEKDWKDAHEYVKWKSFKEYMMREAPLVWRNTDVYQNHDKNIAAFERKMSERPELRDMMEEAEEQRLEEINNRAMQARNRDLPAYGLPAYEDN